MFLDLLLCGVMVLGHVNVHVGTREELDGRQCLWMEQKVFQPAVSVVDDCTMGVPGQQTGVALQSTLFIEPKSNK